MSALADPAPVLSVTTRVAVRTPSGRRRERLVALLAAHGVRSDDDPAPAVVVAALNSTGRDEIALVGRLREAHPQARIVVVTTPARDHDIRRLLSAGADGVVLEADEADALLPTIRAVLAGQSCLPRDLHRLAAPPALSHREREVLSLMASGAHNRQIAEALFITESTVKSHLASAFYKLGVRSRAEATLVLQAERGPA